MSIKSATNNFAPTMFNSKAFLKVGRSANFFGNILSGKNFFHTGKNPKNLLIVTGANGTINQKLIPEAIGKGFEVLALSGNPKQAKKTYGEHPKLKFVQINHCDYTNQSVLEKALNENINGKYDSISTINTLGGLDQKNPRKPQCEEEIKTNNVHAPKIFTDSATNIAKEHTDKQHIVYFSTLAAAFPASEKDCTYANARKNGENEILDITAKKDISSTIFRLGLVINDIEKCPNTGEKILDNGHNHSPENWANQRVIGIIGKGEQVFQPVNASCVVEATLNATSRTVGPNQWIVNGIGSKALSQKQLMTYFTSGKKVFAVHIPYPVAYSLAKIASDGRFQHYAIRMMEMLEKENISSMDSADMELLVGNPLKSMDDTYLRGEQIDEFHCEGLRLARYLCAFFKNSLKNPSDAVDLIKAAMTNSWKVSVIEPTKI